MDESDRNITARSAETAKGVKAVSSLSEYSLAEDSLSESSLTEGSKAEHSLAERSRAERSRAADGAAGTRRKPKEHGGAPAGGKRHRARSRKETGERAGSPRRRRSSSRPGGRKPGGHRQSLAASFGHAFEGIRTGVLEERNMKIHCAAAVLVIVFGLLLHISVTEWCICFALFGLIMGLELVNTAIEAVVDLATQDFHPLAKRAKDTAAGAVLAASIMAAAAGLIIFVPKLLYFFHSLF